MSAGPRFVSADAARAVFRWPDAIAALGAAYRSSITPQTVPPRSIATDGTAWLRVLPAMPAGGRYFGAKLMGSPGATVPPVVEYVIVLFDRDTGSIAAFVDGNVITGLRTAATSALALDRLAPPGPIRLAVLGSGFEASTHVRATAAVRELATVSVFSPNPERREAFASATSDALGVPVVAAATGADAADGADVVIAVDWWNRGARTRRAPVPRISDGRGGPLRDGPRRRAPVSSASSRTRPQGSVVARSDRRSTVQGGLGRRAVRNSTRATPTRHAVESRSTRTHDEHSLRDGGPLDDCRGHRSDA